MLLFQWSLCKVLCVVQTNGIILIKGVQGSIIDRFYCVNHDYFNYVPENFINSYPSKSFHFCIIYTEGSSDAPTTRLHSKATIIASHASTQLRTNFIRSTKIKLNLSTSTHGLAPPHTASTKQTTIHSTLPTRHSIHLLPTSVAPHTTIQRPATRTDGPHTDNDVTAEVPSVVYQTSPTTVSAHTTNSQSSVDQGKSVVIAN